MWINRNHRRTTKWNLLRVQETTKCFALLFPNCLETTNIPSSSYRSTNEETSRVLQAHKVARSLTWNSCFFTPTCCHCFCNRWCPQAFSRSRWFNGNRAGCYKKITWAIVSVYFVQIVRNPQCQLCLCYSVIASDTICIFLFLSNITLAWLSFKITMHIGYHSNLFHTNCMKQAYIITFMIHLTILLLATLFIFLSYYIRIVGLCIWGIWST